VSELPQAAISVRNVTKRFPGVVALKDVTLDVRTAEVHAFVGQNGAGKSTLVKILSGAIEPSSGQILLHGAPVRLATPVEAVARGIATISQEMNLVPTLSVAENVLIGHLPLRHGRVDWPAMRQSVREILKGLGFDIDPDIRVKDLSVAQRQGVEIARALSRRASIVIMDEPTSALAAPEIERLLDTVARFRDRRTSIIYISHKMDEVLRVADRISVFREGERLATLDASSTDRESLVRLMVGQDLRRSLQRRRHPHPNQTPILEIEALSRSGKFQDVSFRLFPGEILGISGLVGSGRTEIFRAIFGADPIDAGSVQVAGKRMTDLRPGNMIALGVGLVPEDRRTQGLILGMSVLDNLSLVELSRRAAYGLRDFAAERTSAGGVIDALSIRTAGLTTPVATLSGGNQQKVAIGKWLLTAPRVLIFDEPTRGIDIAAKGQILRIIEDLANQGTAIILISSEQSEILEVSDRILVLREGRIVAEFDHDEANPEVLTQAAFGHVPAISARPEHGVS
jgi:ABC-type sugar transport system ATPase subunit